MFILIFTVLGILLFIWLKRLNKNYYILALCKRIRTKDGRDINDVVVQMPGKTVFGNNFDVLDMNPDAIFQFCRNNCKFTNGKSYLLHFINTPIYNVINADDAEGVLQSQSLITKGVMYNLLHPFLGEGLLTSTDQKWHSRRKILTPAFHFNILQTFIEIFKEESTKFLNILNRKTMDQPIIALVDLIPQFTLNNVCETALGVKLDNIEGSGEYRQSIHKLEVIFVKRTCNPLMFFPLVFYIWGEYEAHKKYLKIAHDFSSKIIETKRKQFQKRFRSGAVEQIDEFGKKKRYAMLDTLLDAEARGLIDHQSICDEVNTFMFEGYDTTSTCLIFAIFNLALHPEIQEKCYREIENLDDISNLTVFDFNNLEYLECVIKETLRLYPSVPFVSRQCLQETEVNGLILPALSQINIHIYDIMRDAKHFPNPDKFEPERFLPKNTVNRHPFAFVPFSAGPRNCIGQKFALLEIKVLLLTILKNFSLLPVTRLEDIIFENGLVLRTQNHINVKFVKRN